MGMSDVIFPVFLRAKGDKEVREFNSVEQIENWVEAIDVENSEYEGWDSEGFPISLELQGKGSITVKSLQEPAAKEVVFKALRDFATAEGVPLERPLKLRDLHEAYENVRKIVEEERNRRPWWRKLLRRL